ncbi:hypothetical protein N0M98_29120 [Paenibacillus doosanensis]|uniref:YlbF family regulator n=1 Tax=Paenibacillus konkukensis TaxID=2020716 RepID=A0ABY4RQD6_9BACL|nr:MULTISPECIES: hypothetical protein [Paenibacillus]MCS7464168.1 hypothetical protein [Paenibacillus doosanensis]UQZ83773.1 hypothetical protein SK3146_02980 [Paenibacillus konkukensis]
MTKEEVLQQLQQLPEQLKEAEADYYAALSRLEDAKLALRAKECELFSQGLISGRNEQARDAEIWQHTHELQRTLTRAKVAVDQYRVDYDYLKNKLDNAQLMAQLLLQLD